MTLLTSAPPRSRVLVGAALTMLMGGALYSFTVFAGPFAELRGWAMPDVMLAFGMTSMLAPISMIGSGYLLDRGYTRQLVIVGGALFGLGHVLAGISTTLPMFYLSYGLIAGLGQGIMYSAALSNTMKFFPDKRGFASGVITGGMGAGSVLAAPIGRWLVDTVGVSQAFVILGIVFAVVVVLAGLLLVQQCPIGYVPPGWTPPTPANGGQPVAMNWKQMLATRRFWILLPTFICGAFFGLMITSNLSAVAQGQFGVEAGAAAMLVSLLALFNAIGRVAWGSVSDRLGAITSLILVFVLAIAALLLLGTGSGLLVLIVGIIVLGFGFGGVMSLFPALTMTAYGPRHQGVNYGIIFSAYALSGLVAPRWASGIAEGSGGDYSTAFFLAAGIAGLGLVLTLVYRAVSARV